jgi:DNA-binding response OmpR family regulator
MSEVAVLLINGAEPVAKKLALYLTGHGCRVSVVDEAVSGGETHARRYDCVVIDLGEEACARAVTLTRAVRHEFAQPILVIAPGNNVDERVAVLDAGADDCVSAACSERELLSRILASVRRSRGLRSS